MGFMDWAEEGYNKVAEYMSQKKEEYITPLEQKVTQYIDQKKEEVKELINTPIQVDSGTSVEEKLSSIPGMTTAEVDRGLSAMQTMTVKTGNDSDLKDGLTPSSDPSNPVVVEGGNNVQETKQALENILATGMEKVRPVSDPIINAGTNLNAITTDINVIANGYVQSNINLVRNESNLVKGTNVLTDIITLGKTMNVKIATAESVLDSGGSMSVKALTGANTVSIGKEILKDTVAVGKIGQVAGNLAIFTAPFSEINTSMKLVQDDLNLIAKYTPEKYNEALAEAVVISVGDACSAGVLRSIAKTPTALAHLVPGASSDLGASYDKAIDETINVPNLYGGVVKGYEKAVESIKEVGLAVSDLSRNPHSKDLFNAYAKEALNNNGQVWTAEMNKTIAENMLKDGVVPRQVEEALKHSPEPLESAYYFVKDVRNSPEMIQVQQQSTSMGINR